MRVTKMMAMLAALAAVAGCATSQGDSDSAAIRQGEAAASAQCAGCHAIGPSGESSRKEARPFRAIAADYSEASLLRELEAISEVGHYQMPPRPIAREDLQALARYISSLRLPRRRRP